LTIVLKNAVFALLFNTDTERRLKRENRMLETVLPQLEQKEALLADVVANLEIRDDRIYEEMFQTSSPDVDPVSSLDFLHGLDTIPDGLLAVATEEKLGQLKIRSSKVDDNFRQIFEIVTKEGFSAPPMRIPVGNVSFAQIGASVGSRTNPFYKVQMQHDGLDIIASSGEAVYAVADGVVSDIKRSRKGLGNVVTLTHKDGYMTRYAHLADIQVAKGRSIKAGALVGYVGTSGHSYVPHLHYEVCRDTVVLDPVSHFYADIGPQEYVNMLIMSSATKQSLD
jgi:murein DD-endopeptidase MepM/ murein hydrolase activator NlpD